MNACELTTLVTAAANYLACRLTDDELNLLGGNFDPTGGYPHDHCHPKKRLLPERAGLVAGEAETGTEAGLLQGFDHIDGQC